MLTLDNPICEERFYLDDWKPAATHPQISDNEAEQTWRRLSSTEETNPWTPPVSSADTRFNAPKTTPDSSVNWKDKPVEQWTADEVTLWICSLMHYQSMSPFDNSSYCPPVNVAAYLNMTGAELIQLSSTDIQARDPQSGSFVFLALQSHLNQTNAHYNISSTVLPTYTHMEGARVENNMHNPLRTNDVQPSRQDYIKQEPMTKDFTQPRLPSLDLKLISFDVDDHFDSIQSLAKDITVDQLVKNLHILRGTDKQKLNQHTEQPGNNAFASPNMQHNGFNTHQPLNVPTMKPWGEQLQMGSPMVSPGSEGSLSPPADLTGDYHSNYQYNEVKGNHLWEFIRDLLFDSRYNPSLVKWEDREEGVFKFVKSDQVAKLWGKKKNNPAMTYEKLSRAMRYYYRRKILERIDGRRLVYKFGSMATGWKA